MKARTAKWLVLGGIFTVFASLICGAFFGFPYPDASPEEAARIELCADLAFWCDAAALIAIIAGLIRLVQLWLRARASGTR